MKILEISRKYSDLYIRVWKFFVNKDGDLITFGKIRGAMWELDREGLHKIPVKSFGWGED